MLNNIKKLYNEWFLKDTRKYETGEIKNLKYKYMKNRKNRIPNGKRTRRLNNMNNYQILNNNEKNVSDCNDLEIRSYGNRIRKHHNSKNRINKPIKNVKITGNDGNNNNNSAKGRSINRIINSIRDIFLGKDSNYSNYNLNVIPNVTNLGMLNNSERIKKGIKDSKAFQRKINELQYDKLQINKLRQLNNHKFFKDHRLLSKEEQEEDMEGYSMLNDKLKLLKNENEELKRQLYKKDSEIEILTKEIQFLKDNSKIIARDNLIDLLDVKSNFLDEIYDPNINVSPERQARSRSRTRSFSPVRVDLSQYSK